MELPGTGEIWPEDRWCLFDPWHGIHKKMQQYLLSPLYQQE